MNDILSIGRELFLKEIKFEMSQGTSTSDFTLKFSFLSKVYTKTMSFRDSLDEDKVKRNWIELFQLFEKDFPTGNVLVVINNPKEDDMSKEEAVLKYKETVTVMQDAALGQVFDDGKLEGGGGSGGLTQADIDKAVAAALANLPPDKTPFDANDVSKAVTEALAALPKDATVEEMKVKVSALETENSMLKAAIETEIKDSKVDTSRLEAVLAPVLVVEKA